MKFACILVLGLVTTLSSLANAQQAYQHGDEKLFRMQQTIIALQMELDSLKASQRIEPAVPTPAIPTPEIPTPANPTPVIPSLSAPTPAGSSDSIPPESHDFSSNLMQPNLRGAQSVLQQPNGLRSAGDQFYPADRLQFAQPGFQRPMHPPYPTNYAAYPPAYEDHPYEYQTYPLLPVEPVFVPQPALVEPDAYPYVVQPGERGLGGANVFVGPNGWGFGIGGIQLGFYGNNRGNGRGHGHKHKHRDDD